MIFKLNQINNQTIEVPNSYGIELYIKREDKIHDFVSGNKYRKLKYNILEADKLNFNSLLTFGGAFSNHIAAVAAAGKLYGFTTVGVIRGEELGNSNSLNPTLNFAQKCGMQFKFVNRDTYRDKTNEVFIRALHDEFGDFYLIPEGGSNYLAVKGCEEILSSEDHQFDFICCPVGTGGTISGLINCSKPGQQILGFPALKGNFLQTDISKFALKTNWKLIPDYHFGGYAKVNLELIDFINQFKKTYEVPLDPVYTGKMMYGIIDLIEKGYFPEKAKILAIHTGGLQGISGMNAKLKKKHLPLIET
ncbi:1-aminocyclopropane-1-carboxylate deaminase/D-cysteine desulfhydrase [Aestuariibaculum sediminum]|uniref:1-aminocyclopropane-1-carboxylate deaminase/D-cysteine desulfhydrase n=1 Tax=Aestuariibaculum sediminum TaxID=2770637 RepID=A0A8J6QAL3_9FLAO|nr:pyridoxal-phosphate dependent enzyme [Aestuariibaculum sediminum]MBD0833622.1 1-aminocyclopropane-1-carboxylate deaminase/D-cysteine desulfhydrase [Aestuariibaculum sediminum]